MFKVNHNVLLKQHIEVKTGLRQRHYYLTVL